MNNSDERDYAEEAANRRILPDEHAAASSGSSAYLVACYPTDVVTGSVADIARRIGEREALIREGAPPFYAAADRDPVQVWALDAGVLCPADLTVIEAADALTIRITDHVTGQLLGTARVPR